MVDVKEMQPIALGRLLRVFRRLIHYEATVLPPAIVAIRPKQAKAVAQASSACASAVVAHGQIPVTPYFPLLIAPVSTRADAPKLQAPKTHVYMSSSLAWPSYLLGQSQMTSPRAMRWHCHSAKSIWRVLLKLAESCEQ